MKQKPYSFGVTFKSEKEGWCVIVYITPQALGLNVFGLMKLIPYSPTLHLSQKTTVIRPSSGNMGELCIWLVCYNIHKTHSHVHQTNLL